MIVRLERRFRVNDETIEQTKNKTENDDHWSQLFAFLRASVLHMLMTEEEDESKNEFRDEIITNYRFDILLFA